LSYSEFQPAVRLKSYVQCYWMMRSPYSIETPSSHQILPDGCMDILFELRNHSVEVVGTMTKAFHAESVDGMEFYGIRFNPAGIFPFIQMDASDFTDASADAQHVLGGWMFGVVEKLRSDISDQERVELLNSFLIERLATCEQDDVRFLSFLSKLEKSERGVLRVEEALGMVGMSQRTLERYFQKQVGISAKKFLSVLRFRRILREIGSQQSIDWADLAIRHGYHDQSHFVHEFKGFTGTTPAKFLLNDPSLSDFYNTLPPSD
jgi:AraC-like DNA-binding protein